MINEVMRFYTHLWTSALTAFAVYHQRPLQGAVCTLSGVLIDVDHLIVYGLRTGDWSIAGAFTYDQYRNRRVVPGDTRPRYGGLRSLFHQPLIVLPSIWLLAYYRPVLRPIALGLTLHLMLDNLDLLIMSHRDKT